MIKDIQSYLRVNELPSITYRVCNKSILIPYSKELDEVLKPYNIEYQDNDIVVKTPSLPTHYTAYSILPDKRTKPKRITDLAPVYKVGECIITLEKGNLILCTREYNKKIGVDSPKNRTIAYISGLLYHYMLIQAKLTDMASE